MKYIEKKDLGYNKENILILKRAWALKDQRKAFKEELSREPYVESISMTNDLPSYIHGSNAFRPEGSSPDEIRVTNFYYTDENFLQTMNLEMKEGRWFSTEKPSDSTAVILNEAAVKAYGFTDPVGKHILQIGGKRDSTDLPLKIIGVVNDFNYESLHQTIQPLIIGFNRNRFSSYFALRIQKDNYQQAIQSIKEKWSTIVPDQPLEYTFLEDALKTNYNDNKNEGILFAIFSILAIFISSLGLLGLASYSAEQRTKEIGIRKVMGSSITQIVNLLTKEVLILMGIASVISWPLAWYFTKNWLQNFAYHENPGFFIYLLASILASVVAIVTISFQAFKAASTNPANSLRYE
jgi:putative ABC transport system permease protein